MPAIGLLMMLLGGFLFDCAYRNVSPVETFRDVLKHPDDAEKALTAHGSAYVVSGGGTVSGVGDGSHTAVGGAASQAIAYARAQIGKPYGWGKTGPDKYDCSGLVMMAYRSAGIKLPRTTGQMVLVGSTVKKGDLMPGDLVFPDPGHVQLYTGGGMVVEAPRTGENVREVKMWGFWTAKRVVQAGTKMGGTF